jgi:hypothetical protein
MIRKGEVSILGDNGRSVSGMRTVQFANERKGGLSAARKDRASKLWDGEQCPAECRLDSSLLSPMSIGSPTSQPGPDLNHCQRNVDCTAVDVD